MKGKKIFTIWKVSLVVSCFLIGCTHTQRLSNLNNVSLNKNITVFDKRPQEDFVYIAVGLPGGSAKLKLIPPPKVYLHEQLSLKLDHESNKNTLIEISIKLINLQTDAGFFKVKYFTQIISDLKIVRNDNVITKEIITNGNYSSYDPYAPPGNKESIKRALDNLIYEVIKHLRKQQSQWGPWIKIEDKKEQ